MPWGCLAGRMQLAFHHGLLVTELRGEGALHRAPDRGGAVLAISKGSRAFPVVLGGSVALVVFMWCLKTSWRVVSGRPRNDGGLLSPWLIAAAGGFRCVGHVWHSPNSDGPAWVERCGWEQPQSAVSPSPGDGFEKDASSDTQAASNQPLQPTSGACASS
jgi:hypothetical protein